jgi:hypothetical protein
MGQAATSPTDRPETHSTGVDVSPQLVTAFGTFPLSVAAVGLCRRAADPGVVWADDDNDVGDVRADDSRDLRGVAGDLKRDPVLDPESRPSREPTSNGGVVERSALSLARSPACDGLGGALWRMRVSCLCDTGHGVGRWPTRRLE